MAKLPKKQLLISIFFVIALLALLAYFVDWRMVLEMLSGVKPALLVVASIFLLLGFFAYAQRWRLLLEKRTKYMPTFHAANAGNMVNTLLPMRPGDAARILILGGGQDVSMAFVTSSIVVERWFEQIMRLAALGGAMLFGMGMAISLTSIIGMVVFMVVMYVLMLWMIQKREKVLAVLPGWIARLPRLNEESVRSGLENLIDGLSGVKSARYLLMLLIWSFITWGLFWAFHYIAFLAMGVEADSQTILAMSLGALAFVPPSAATLPGIYQVSMVVPLALVGFDENLLTSYALVLNSLEMLWILGLGLWGAFQGGYTLRRLLARRTET